LKPEDRVEELVRDDCPGEAVHDERLFELKDGPEFKEGWDLLLLKGPWPKAGVP
jgi:hypothetical protein